MGNTQNTQITGWNETQRSVINRQRTKEDVGFYTDESGKSVDWKQVRWLRVGPGVRAHCMCGKPPEANVQQRFDKSGRRATCNQVTSGAGVKTTHLTV